MVLTMMPATVFAADGEVAARASETGGLYEYLSLIHIYFN